MQPTVLILASGASRRFLASGGLQNKLVTLLAGRPLLDHTIAAVAASGLPWHLVQGIEGGMGSSIAAGVAATEHAAGWLILPADLPLIQPRSLQQVAALLQQHALVVPSHNNTAGHPVGFRREHLDALLALHGEDGAKAIVRRQRLLGAVHDAALDDPGICLDVDTVDDLARMEASMLVANQTAQTGARDGKH